jgi:hypothetical protein
MYRGTASFILRSPRIIINCPPGSNGFEVDGGGVKVRVKCEGGAAVYELEAVSESQEAIREKAELFAYSMSLIHGVGFEMSNFTMAWLSIAPQTVSDGKATVPVGVIVPIKYQLVTTEYINEALIRGAMELMNKLENALQNPDTNKRAEVLLRVIKWWVSGGLDEDPLDKFLKFFIVFEMLASLMKHKEKSKKGKNKDHEEKSGGSWVEEFCKKYGLACEFEGMRVNEVRNLIMHEPGEDRDRAEEVARKHADEFGQEVLKAVWRVLSEELKISI